MNSSEYTHKQIELEREQSTRGHNKFVQQIEQANQQGALGKTAVGASILNQYVKKLQTKIEDYFMVQKLQGPKASVAFRLLNQYDTHAVSYITISSLVSVLDHEMKSVTACKRLGTELAVAHTTHLSENSKEYRDLVKAAKAAVDVAGASLEDDNELKLKAYRSALKAMEWSVLDATKVGQTMFQLAIDTGIIQEVNVKVGKNSVPHVAATDETSSIIDAVFEAATVPSVSYPMIVPPVSWDLSGKGGYLTLPKPFIRAARTQQAKQIRKLDMPRVYAAVNAMQATPWKVEKAMLDLIKECKKREMNIKNLGYDVSLTEEENIEVRARTNRVISLANRFVDEKSIYFPHSCDYRGRVYPITTDLQPQGCSLTKSLLSYSGGSEVGERGSFWVAYQVSSEFGNDKMSINERVAWTLDNSDRIDAIAKNPFGADSSFWITSDSPFGFIRACMEWSRYLANPSVNFKSTLPITLDGSASGIQHLSALFKDEVGGKSVNLVAGEREDLYTDAYAALVGKLKDISEGDTRLLAGIEGDPSAWFNDLCRELLDLDDAIKLETDPGVLEVMSEDREVLRDEKGAAEMVMRTIWAKEWLDSPFLKNTKVGRTMVKPACMTWAYAVTLRGIKTSLVKEAKGIVGKTGSNHSLPSSQSFTFLASLVADSVSEVVVKATEAMDFFKACVRYNKGKALSYTMPDGFPFAAEVLKPNAPVTLSQTIAGRRTRMNFSTLGTNLNNTRMLSSISAGLTHGLDSCHMRTCALAAKTAGIKFGSYIHDSFGCSASEMDTMYTLVRETFSAQYHDTNIAEQLNDKWMDGKAKLTYGTLDLSREAMLDCEFAFA